MMKRTTVTLPNDLLEMLKKTVKAKNKTRAVIMAIEGEIRRNKLEKLKKMAGHMEFEREANDIRHGDERLNYFIATETLPGPD